MIATRNTHRHSASRSRAPKNFHAGAALSFRGATTNHGPEHGASQPSLPAKNTAEKNGRGATAITAKNRTGHRALSAFPPPSSESAA